MAQQTAQVIFQQVQNFLMQDLLTEKNQASSYIQSNNHTIIFTLIDRLALNRLLASGYSKQQALLVSAVPHIITIHTDQFDPQCILEQKFMVPLEDNFKKTSIFIQIYEAETFLLDLQKCLSTKKYQLAKLEI
ncbi:MAG: hypothetical protein KBT36_16755 [Kurthia sp.]|nr:hypothetical protein [Candidatus Kurthia equi]